MHEHNGFSYCGRDLRRHHHLHGRISVAEATCENCLASHVMGLKKELEAARNRLGKIVRERHEKVR